MYYNENRASYGVSLENIITDKTNEKKKKSFTFGRIDGCVLAIQAFHTRIYAKKFIFLIKNKRR